MTMKKIKVFVVVLFVIVVLYLISASLGSVHKYPPAGIPFPYDPNVVMYKLLGGIDLRAGQEVIMDVNCYDPDGDAFSIRVLNWQVGMNCTNGTTWKLKWTPTTLQEGLHYINIEAWDFPPDPNDSLTDKGTFVFNVRPRNRPPILLPWN